MDVQAHKILRLLIRSEPIDDRPDNLVLQDCYGIYMDTQVEFYTDPQGVLYLSTWNDKQPLSGHSHTWYNTHEVVDMEDLGMRWRQRPHIHQQAQGAQY